MSATSQELLVLAQELATNSTEIWQRAACSRAYYAIFHGCLAFARTRSYTPAKVDAHEALIRFMTDYEGLADEQRRVRQTGHQIRDIKLLRVRADYDLANGFAAALARQAIETASRILRRMSALESFPAT